jgi:hypothetical protein
VPEKNGVPDLSRAAVLGELSQEVQVEAEVHSGMRCGGCRRRITLGFRFVNFRAELGRRSGRGVIEKQETFACTRADCDYAMKAAQKSVAVSKVEYAWLDDPATAAVFGRQAEEPADVGQETSDASGGGT